MSSALAIASVTLVIKDLLNNGLIDHDITGAIGGNVTVSCLPPDLMDTSNNGPIQLNLFMYHVTENIGWRNSSYPSMNSSGEKTSNPPLALDLHYLLTAYSSEELIAEILLGYGMQLLHENPVLVRDNIRKTLALPSLFSSTGLPSNLQALSTSKLAEQVEQIKLTPSTMNTEELSKLWTAFQAKYRPTAAYVATVVLIESEKSTKSALPVKDRNVYVRPFKQPFIEQVGSKSSGTATVSYSQKILHDYLLVITGKSLKADDLTVNIDGVEYEPVATDITDTQIILQLPAGLSAGIHGTQINTRINMGTPEVLHSGVQSNIEAFVLSPVINSISLSNVVASGSSFSANVNLNVKPGVGDQQRILLLLNQIDNLPGTNPLAYSFQNLVPISPPGTSENIIIPVSAIKAGKYLVRLQVDGAESPLFTDLLTGKYNAPVLTIP